MAIIKFALVAIFTLLVGCGNTTVSIEIMNNSDVQLTSGYIEYLDTKEEFLAVNPGESAFKSIEINRDGQLYLTVNFEGGTSIKDDVGYVTNSMGGVYKATVTATEVAVEWEPR